jgi:CheY-like chemotaxis protein
MGYSAFLTKPIRQSDLYDCLSQIMGISTEDKNKHETQLITRHTINENRKIKTRILLVEDNLINRKVATAIFKKIGYNTDLAVDGMDALGKLKSEPYDIVFMDLQMPRMGGFEATKKIRQGKAHGINHKIPIIAMTANAMKGDREKCLKAGMDDYLSKPIKVEAILSMINKWLPKPT